MKPTTGVVIAVLLVAAVIGVVVFSTGSDESSPATTETTTSSTEAEPATEPTGSTEITFTAAEVAEHATADDCWTIIDGTVYDVTGYVTDHPGGEEILRACGQDGTTLFNSRTTEDGETVGSGTPHSANARSILSGFEIGTLMSN